MRRRVRINPAKNLPARSDSTSGRLENRREKPPRKNPAKNIRIRLPGNRRQCNPPGSLREMFCHMANSPEPCALKTECLAISTAAIGRVAVPAGACARMAAPFNYSTTL